MVRAGLVGVKGFKFEVPEDTVTVPVTVTFVGLFGTSFEARCSARSLSKVLLRPVTVRRNETVCALHVSDLVQGLPVSSIHTPQCRSGSYSRSLSNDRSVLSLFRRGWLVAVPGLFTGLELITLPDPEFDVWTDDGNDSRGDRGDDEIGIDEDDKFVEMLGCSVLRFTFVWLILLLPLFEIWGDDCVFFSFDTLQ